MRRALDAAATAGAAAAHDVAPLAKIDSVHVAALDAEHEACAAALARLAEAPTKEAIAAVVAAYEAHFAHEEALLDEHLYASAAAKSGGFDAAGSARRSHFADHKRMLADLERRAAALPAGGGTTHVPDGEAPAVFVDRVLRSFEQHANVYDAAYAQPLAAKLREAEAVEAH